MNVAIKSVILVSRTVVASVSSCSRPSADQELSRRWQTAHIFKASFPAAEAHKTQAT